LGAVEAPPVYGITILQTTGFAFTAQVALLVVKAICRNTKILLGTPAAPPTESSTRTTNE
jgi:hypothetical protein